MCVQVQRGQTLTMGLFWDWDRKNKAYICSWRSFTAGKTRETSFTLMRKTREMSLHTTRNNRCCICPVGRVCNSPCVHQFHHVPFDLCLPKDQHKEWVKESNHELSEQSQRDEHRGAHLVAFVSSFTLRRTHTAFISQDHKLVQWSWKHQHLFKYSVFVQADSTFSPLPPRSPWKQKDTHQNHHHCAPQSDQWEGG